MTQLQTMYPGVANSPDTFLIEGLTIDGTVMYVADGAVFGEIPTLAVIGQAELAETVQITGKQSDGGYTIIRGVEGKRQAWAKATNVVRNWTNKDYETLRTNITTINDWKVDKIFGKGLSSNDYDDEAKAKVDAIPPDPKYTDTVPDLTPYAKMSDLSKEYDERKADISKVMSDHAADIQSVRTDYTKDIKTAKDALTVDINNVKTAHDADIKRVTDAHTVDVQRLESQKLNKTDVVNDLITPIDTAPLSAEQGMVLDQRKLNKTDVVNDLTTGGTDKALSAEQGKTLFTYADNGKKSIADAIVGKGVSATKSDSFGVLADKISKIKTGYGAGDVLPEDSVQVVKVRDDSKVKWGRWESNINEGPCSSLCVDRYDRLYCFNKNGEIWQFDENFNIAHSIKHNYGATHSIAIDTSGCVLYCGEETNGIRSRIIGSTDIDSNFFSKAKNTYVISRIVIGHDGCVYAGDSGGVIYKISKRGDKIWEKYLFESEGKSFIESIECLAVDNSGFIYSCHFGHVCKTSPMGEKLWMIDLDCRTPSVVVGLDNCIYVGCALYASSGTNGKVTKISPTGKILWKVALYEKEVNAMTVGLDGCIWCGGGDNKIYKLSPDGKTLFTGRNVETVNGVEQDINETRSLVTASDGRIFGSSETRNGVFTLIDGAYKTSYKILK